MKSCMPRRVFCIRLICWLAHSETSIEAYPFPPKTVLPSSGMQPSAQHCRKLTNTSRSPLEPIYVEPIVEPIKDQGDMWNGSRGFSESAFCSWRVRTVELITIRRCWWDSQERKRSDRAPDECVRGYGFLFSWMLNSPF